MGIVYVIRVCTVVCQPHPCPNLRASFSSVQSVDGLIMGTLASAIGVVLRYVEGLDKSL